MRTAATPAHARSAVLALFAALATVFALVGVTKGGPDTTVVAAMLLGAAMLWSGSTSMRFAGRQASPAARMPVPSRGCSGHVEAPSAYWCAVPTPARPRLPRAPGQR